MIPCFQSPYPYCCNNYFIPLAIIGIFVYLIIKKLGDSRKFRCYKQY